MGADRSGRAARADVSSVAGDACAARTSQVSFDRVIYGRLTVASATDDPIESGDVAGNDVAGNDVAGSSDAVHAESADDFADRSGDAEVADGNAADGAEPTDGAGDNGPDDGAGDTLSGPDLLEREGEAAADYLEGLLDIIDVDGDIDMDVENDRAVVAVIGEHLRHLVGQGGSVLDALQELTRLAVARETGVRSRLMLDIAGYRARRRAELSKIGTQAAEKALSSGTPVVLNPMSAFERKVVHDAVAAAGLRSESEGVEPERYVVVLPTKRSSDSVDGAVDVGADDEAPADGSVEQPAAVPVEE